MKEQPSAPSSGKPIDPALASQIEALSATERQGAIVALLDMAAEKETLLRLSTELNKTLDLSDLIREAVFTVSSLLEADRASLLIVDAERGELWSKVAQGLETKEIRIPITSGIAGLVARTGNPVNLKDAYESSDFNRQIDLKTGYRTKSMLALPVRNRQNRIIAVIQVINKKSGEFTAHDEALLSNMSNLLALSLENAFLYDRITTSQRQIETLLKVANALSSQLDLDTLIQTIMSKVTEILEADRATLFLIDKDRGELWSKIAQGTQEIRFPVTQGIAGHVASSGATLNIPNAYEHPLFNKAIDLKTGYHTKTILCMPIRNGEGEIIGVTQVINKLTGVFTASDEQMLAAFSAQASIAIENAKLYDRTLSLKNFLDSVLQNLSSGVVTLDSQGRITLANQAAEKILDLPPDRWLNAPAVEVFGPKAGNLLGQMQKVLIKGSRIQEFDADYNTASGKPCSLNLTIETLKDLEGGEKSGVVAILEDMTKEKRQRSMISRFLSKDVADRFLSEDWNGLMKGSMAEVTLLFSDIRSFTSITESTPAPQVVEMLNDYFSHMVDAIFSCRGTLDKYMGDAIMAIFGAPIPDPQNALHAIQAALKMRSELARFNQRRTQQGLFTVRFGIGLSTGEALCGTIGSEKKMEYTSIGDGVNLASRLEGANKFYGTEILISEFTFQHVKQDVQVREVDRVRVKGKDIAVRVYELIGMKGDSLSDQTAELLGTYECGYQNFHKREFSKAAENFQRALSISPEDRASRLWLDRCEECLKQAPAQDWDGTFELHEK